MRKVNLRVLIPVTASFSVMWTLLKLIYGKYKQEYYIDNFSTMYFILNKHWSIDESNFKYDFTQKQNLLHKTYQNYEKNKYKSYSK